MKVFRKETLKKSLNTVFIVGTFGVVLYFALRSGDIVQVKNAILAIDFRYLLAALGCFAAHMVLEGGIPYVFFRMQHIKTKLSSNVAVGMIGMYYSSITPAATGGQPMQVYALKKRGVPPGISSSALTVKFFCWQCALLLIGGFLWLYDTAFVGRNMLAGVWLLRIGFFLNSLTVVGVLMLAINRNLVRAIIVFFVNLMHKLHLVKDKAATASAWDAALNDFHSSVRALMRHPIQFVVMMILSAVQVTALMSIIFFVYRGFNLIAATYRELVTMQLMLYISASFTPLPGASGAQEGGFYLFFGNFFPNSTIFAAMFIWRFLTYYIAIIFGFASVLLDSAYRKHTEPRCVADSAEEVTDA